MCQPETPTLFVPADKQFPVADFLLASSEEVILFQLTVSDALVKVPTDKNSYRTIYNSEAFAKLVKEKQLKLPKGSNFAESLLQLIGKPTKVTVDPETKLLVGGTTTIPFSYVVVSACDVKKEGNWQQKTNEFPWIRVIPKSSLTTYFPFLDLL